MSLAELRLNEASELIKNRRITAAELLDDYLKIALKGCCITFCNDLAFETVKKLDEIRRFDTNASPIAGLPFSLKDNIPAAGTLTTCNSRSYKQNRPDYNAVIAENLLGLNAVLVAKNCMREFSVGKIEDSAFELRNYLVWAGTNKNVNIGAFSIGTDLGLSDFYCGLWTLKPLYRSWEHTLSKGIITGSPSLEKVTYSTRCADDLSFLYPFMFGKSKYKALSCGASAAFNPSRCKILICDSFGTSSHIADFFSENGFCAQTGSPPFLKKAELIFDCILATEFFNELHDIAVPFDTELNDVFSGEEYIINRSEGFGFETKRLILTGAHLLSDKNKDNTQRIITHGRKEFIKELSEALDKYDFIAAPIVYDDLLSKASAIAGLSELTVPFGDSLPFKIVTKPERESLLLDMALFLEERL